MHKNRVTITALLLSSVVTASAQTVSGRITNADTKEPVEFASVLFKESRLYAYTDEKGHFSIHNVPEGKSTVIIQCLGYAPKTMTLTVPKAGTTLNVALEEENLKLDEVVVVAKRKSDAATTSYTIDRTTLDNQQIINVSDIASLLPGGKSVNPSLMNDDRLALRSGTSERGNASFGTAVEVDGMRLNNNAAMGETAGASTRSLGTSSIESVEIVSGIPSVEYGDLSNGIVKVNTRKGKSPFIFEASVNQHTRQVALNKGFDLGGNAGMLNFSIEHARSFADAASPHTAYQRNVLSLHYMNVLWKDKMPLTINAGLRGNFGGYNSEADPDEDLEDYTKVRDHNFSGNVILDWQLNRPWITSLNLSASLSYSDKKATSYYNTSSASTQPYIHTLTEGYNIAQDYDSNPTANIILGPTGYWYVKRYNDTKPLDYSVKLKALWTRQSGIVHNRLMLGGELTGNKNYGHGSYYDDMRYAPTWREYRYVDLPAMLNTALYAEDKVSIATSKLSTFELTAGLREDITTVSGSDYGSVSSLSPRFTNRYIFFAGRKTWVSDLSVHAGWGKSVKLPSFQVLYPSPSYRDMLVFSSTSDADNRSYYAYYTYPSTALHNRDLKWQYSHQWDLGLEMRTKIADISASYFYNKTFRPYMATSVYTPFQYKYTAPSAAQQSGIPVGNRTFSVNPATGVITVGDATGAQASAELPYSDRYTYVANTKYVNASSLSRSGLEWIIDFAQIKPIRTQIRIDGNYYRYKGLDETLFADVPLGLNTRQSDGQLYSYIGYYRGGNASSTNYDASASVANGSLSRQVNLNATITTHIPKIRLIVALRIETSLYHYNRALSQYSDGSRGYVVESSDEYFGTPYDGSSENKTLVVFPEYYSTWQNPNERIPFYERFLWARDNDRNLYNDLAALVVRSNYPYTMNPNRLSKFWSANISVTKEIGDNVSVSFYANNFFNTMKRVHSSQTDLDTTLFGSGYVPSFYYGLSLRLKI